MTEFTKGPGWDWDITYQFADEPIETMSVFGQLTVEDAVREARRSFRVEDRSELVILKVEHEVR